MLLLYIIRYIGKLVFVGESGRHDDYHDDLTSLTSHLYAYTELPLFIILFSTESELNI